MTGLDKRRLEDLLELLNRDAPGAWARCETPEEIRFPHAVTVQMRIAHHTIYVTQSIDGAFPNSLRHDVRISPHFLGSIVFLMSDVPGCVQRLALDALATHQEE